MAIEIHLDGKPVTKLQAARACAEIGSEPVFIGEENAEGVIEDAVLVSARYRMRGEIQRPEIGCGQFCVDTPEEARQQARVLLLAAEIAELAEMIAAEQVEAPARVGVPEQMPIPASHYCDSGNCEVCGDGLEDAATQADDRGTCPQGNPYPDGTPWCALCGTHHRVASAPEPVRISGTAVDKAMASAYGWCPATTGPDEELDRALYCDKQLGEDSKHAGNHHAHVGDGSEVAWGAEDDPYIRKGTRWPAGVADARRTYGDEPNPPHHMTGNMIGPCCVAEDAGYICNAQDGHDGPDHVAYDSKSKECHRWPVAEPAPAGAQDTAAEATPEERLLLAVYGVNPDKAANVRELRTHAAECGKDDHHGCLAHLAGQNVSAAQ